MKALQQVSPSKKKGAPSFSKFDCDPLQEIFMVFHPLLSGNLLSVIVNKGKSGFPGPGRSQGESRLLPAKGKPYPPYAFRPVQRLLTLPTRGKICLNYLCFTVLPSCSHQTIPLLRHSYPLLLQDPAATQPYNPPDSVDPTDTIVPA